MINKHSYKLLPETKATFIKRQFIKNVKFIYTVSKKNVMCNYIQGVLKN